MKHLLLIFILIASPLAGAEFQNATQASLKLKSYTAEKLKNAVGENKDKLEDELIDDVDAAVKLALSNKPDSEFLKTLLGAASLSLQNDPSIYAAELLVPLYKKEKSAVQKALQSLPKKEAKDLEESIKDKINEDAKGNG